MAELVTVSDVGPRDGLQNQPRILTPQQRLQLIEALVAAGLKHIEFGSFVSPKAVPAMAGTEEVAALLPRGDIEYISFVPNLKGYQRAREAGVRSVVLAVAATDTMNQKNIRMDTAEAMAVCGEVIAQGKKDGVAVHGCVATAWECPFEGATDPGQVSRLANRMRELGANHIVIADTIGAAHPRQVGTLMKRLAGELGADTLTCHFHDTRAMALANAYAALEAGIRRFDASVGGLGGCPFAPGATGNVATEDLVMMLTQMGFDTGIDLEKLIAAGRLAGELTGAPTGGRAAAWLSRNAHRVSSRA
jgi:hydroxymethylglutaryl-CoA lyase